MDWIKNPRGDYYNIANAVMGEAFDTPRVGRRVRLKNRTGDEIVIVSPDVLEPPDITIAGPIPACFINRAGSVQWRSVVAWRVSSSGNAEPVLLAPLPDGEMYLHLANGALIGAGELYPDLQHAV